LDEVAQIEKICFSTPWSRALFEGALHDTNSAWFIAEADGFVTGYAGLLDIAGEGHVLNIAVSPEYRRLGIGKRLMESLLARARDRQMELVTLEVRESGSAARTLYEKLGFKIAGRRPGYYEKPEEDAILMTLMLKNSGVNDEYTGY
jgi:ribosomal-protein-alanine N-acetyltransferase